MKFETYEVKLPTWALAYLINGDSSSLEDYEVKMIDDWVESMGFNGYAIYETSGEHPYFSSSPAFGMACDVEDVTVYTPIEEVEALTAYFNDFSLELEHDDVYSCSHQGSCDEDVEQTLKLSYIQKQLDAIGPEKIRQELKEYGAWDEEELKQEEANKARILWIAAGNIRDEGAEE